MEMSSKSQMTLDTIRSSFLELMEEKPYAKIGISDITDKANIARQTFYTYFQSKDELLMSFMDDKFDDFFEKIQPLLTDALQTQKVAEMLYQQWYDHYDILLMVLKSDVDHLIFKRFRQYVNRVLGNALRRNGIVVPDPKLIEFVVDHIVGSHFHVIKHWMLDGMPYSPKEMAHLHLSLHSINHPATVEILSRMELRKINEKN